MNLYVSLFAQPFLSEILISNQHDRRADGRPDVEQAARTADLRAMLASYRATEDLDPSAQLQNINSCAWACVSGQGGHQATRWRDQHAEVCLERIAVSEYVAHGELASRPSVRTGGEPCGWAILGMGKLGGERTITASRSGVSLRGRRTDGAGNSAPRRNDQQPAPSAVGQRIIKVASRLGPYGKLYEVDPRLRPTGKSGALATSFAEFTRYFAEGDGQLWERQALTKARVVVSAEGAGAEATRLAEEAAYQHRFNPADAAAIRDMRRRLEDASTPTNLKRGAGGIVDIEFLVRMLQLKHGRERRLRPIRCWRSAHLCTGADRRRGSLVLAITSAATDRGVPAG
jgi:glutamate-ammonia-ligase adenylyltransferase